jgi:hypothetical protein
LPPERRTLDIPRAAPQDRIERLAVRTTARRMATIRTGLLDLEPAPAIWAPRISSHEVGRPLKGIG